MNRSRIVSTAPIDRIARDILEQIAPVEISPAPDEKTMLGMLENTIALVARGVEGGVTGQMIRACPTLRVIGRPGAGYDNVDVATATEHQIPVVYAPVAGFAVAEGALALLLTLVKKIPLCDSIVKSGQWKKRYELTTGDMAEKTLGIIGCGRIGARLAQLAQPFGLKILGYDPCVSESLFKDFVMEMVSLRKLLQESDYISIHVPLTRDTQGLIDKESIALMKRGAILINTARGGVVKNLDVLADALESGQLGAVGLDVFPVEPPDSTHRLFKDPRLVCAPHLLGVSDLAMDRIYRSMSQDMVAVLGGKQPKYCVNPQVLKQ